MFGKELKFFPDTTFPFLEAINGIKFTDREIDVLALVLGRRTAKKIASFLSISPKTVESHIRNIMGKVGCNSRERIVEFIENAEEIYVLKQHSARLVLRAFFYSHLEEVKRLVRKEESTCAVCYPQGDNNLEKLAHWLSYDLQLAGISNRVAGYKNAGSVSLAIKNADPSSDSFLLYLLPEERENLIDEILRSYPVIDRGDMDFSQKESITVFLTRRSVQESTLINFPPSHLNNTLHQESYYISFFKTLKIFLPHFDLEGALVKLRKISRNGSSVSAPPATTRVSEFCSPSKSLSLPSRRIYAGIISFTAICCGLAFFFLPKWENIQHFFQQKAFLHDQIRSELVLPHPSVFLNRSTVIRRLESFFRTHAGLQIVALIGPGGAGKTTLARQYSRAQKAPIIWEINAETKESIRNSFESLAQALTKTEDDQKTLKNLQEIKDSFQRTQQILTFVKEHLVRQPGWVLMYDNIEKLSVVQQFLPQDPDVWGEGKILLTTRDRNIENNGYVSGSISIDELNENQKMELFCKIINHGNAQSPTTPEREELRKFLANIPSFPLDVGVAAYYLKATGVPYDVYLEALNNQNKSFDNIQSALLSEMGTYTRTRYIIITLSLNKIIEAHPDFAALLLLVNSLNSQHIPRPILERLKGKVVTDNFIYHLKKYSLLINDTNTKGLSTPTYSLHKSTQEIGLAYLRERLNLGNEKYPLQEIINTLEGYIEDIKNREDLISLRLFTTHCKKILSHKNLLTLEMKGFIEGELGYIYYYLDDYSKAKKILTESIDNLKNDKTTNPVRIARSLVYLGIVNRELGDYNTARQLLDQSLKLYEQYPTDQFGLALNLGFLGIVHKSVGDYEKAKDFLSQSLVAYKKHFLKTHGKMVWVLTYLGNIYRELGDYKRAKNLLEQSLSLYKKHFSANHIKVAWVLAHLGKLHSCLEEYDKARDLLEESLALYKTQFSEGSVIAWVLTHLGNAYSKLGNYDKSMTCLKQALAIYTKNLSPNSPKIAQSLECLGNVHRELGHYKEAKKLLLQSLEIYEKHYNKDHLKTAKIERALGKIALKEGQIPSATQYFMKVLEILQRENHPDQYLILEDIGTLYLHQAQSMKETKSSQHFQDLMRQALTYLHKSLKIATLYLPVGAPSIVRIQSRIATATLPLR